MSSSGSTTPFSLRSYSWSSQTVAVQILVVHSLAPVARSKAAVPVAVLIEVQAVVVNEVLEQIIGPVPVVILPGVLSRAW